MAIPLIPWEPHCFPAEIQAELRRRSTNRGLNYVNNGTAVWSNDEDDWNKYKGPMTSWVRVCSNGAGLPRTNKPGFVMYGGKDFYTAYGFNKGGKGYEPNNSIIGYTPEGVPHIIENDLVNSAYPIHVAPPDIEKISATIQKELLRRVSIEFTCFSFKQLEYLTPYFLVPGISVVVEWGWNHFNPLSLLNLADTDTLKNIYNNPYPLYTNNILSSRGNYEVVFGIITNFEWSIEGQKIKARIEVTSKDRIWAGQVVNVNMIETDTSQDPDPEDKGKEPTQNIKVIDSVKKFVDSYTDMFKNFGNQTQSGDAIVSQYLNNPSPDKQPLQAFIQHLKEFHPTNYKDYLFGVFFGRDEGTTSSQLFSKGANVKYDFDLQSPRKNFWINLGLVTEIINFHCSQIKGVKNQPAFRVDVEDCIIGGHPNLISTNGDILLIPNAMAPKVQSGNYGYVQEKKRSDYTDLMNPSTVDKPFPTAPQLDPTSIPVSLTYADYRLKKILFPMGRVRRDDLNVIINHDRILKGQSGIPTEFPFSRPFTDNSDGTSRTYQQYYTGFFKNLYINAEEFKRVLNDPAVIRFPDIFSEIFRRINSAASEFWDLKLVGTTGRKANTNLATMKIVDQKLTQYSSNDLSGVFTFDYYAADSLLHGVNFRPMLSNAQAIRTIYAQTNNTQKQVVISDKNELLDYTNFKDRLFLSDDKAANVEKKTSFNNGSFKISMGRLQSVEPPDKSFQMTMNSQTSSGVKPVVFRLAIPTANADILTLLLDDNDKIHNPRYIGIMPGIQAEFTIQGIAGLRTFGMFRVRGLPEPYSEENIVFRIVNVQDTVQNGSWTTQIVAGVIPLRGYLRSKLALPAKSQNKGQ
jgi:hypothetical protein